MRTFISCITDNYLLVKKGVSKSPQLFRNLKFKVELYHIQIIKADLVNINTVFWQQGTIALIGLNTFFTSQLKIFRERQSPAKSLFIKNWSDIDLIWFNNNRKTLHRSIVNPEIIFFYLERGVQAPSPSYIFKDILFGKIYFYGNNSILIHLLLR